MSSHRLWSLSGDGSENEWGNLATDAGQNARWQRQSAAHNPRLEKQNRNLLNKSNYKGNYRNEKGYRQINKYSKTFPKHLIKKIILFLESSKQSTV